jgi:hypothetical protein
MLSALGHKSSMGHLFYCFFCACFQHWVTSPLWVTCSMAKSHTSPLWVTCFGVGRLFSYPVPHKSSMGHLFRCGSSILLSGPTHTSPLWVTYFGVGHLFSNLVSHKSSMGRLFRCESLVLFSVCTCACVCVCMCIESLCREITPPATLLQWEVKVVFVFARMPLTRLSKCFSSSRSDAVDLALRLHSIAVDLVIDPHSPWR